MNEPAFSEKQSVAVRRIMWGELFPWLVLVRVFRCAIAPGPLLLATAAVALTSLGWWVTGYVLLSEEQFQRQRGSVLLAGPVAAPGHHMLDQPNALESYLPANYGVTQPFKRLAAPAMRLFSSDTTLVHVVYYLIGFLISIAVWAFAGGVISRQALVQIGTDQAYDWLDAARFVAPRYLQYFLAPLAPLLAVVAMGLLVVPLGWLMRLDFGLLVAGLLWIFVIGLGLIAAWLIIGLFFGWPLMFGVIGSKRDGDSLQAFSDSFSYVYGKPLHYLWYAFVALAIGGLALFVIHLFALAATEFGWWAASWGAGLERTTQIRREVDIVKQGGDLAAPAMHEGGVELIALVLNLVEVIELAAAYSYFFVAAAVIFLLLRLAVDEKEMDEVHLEEDEEQLETARRGMLSDEAAAPPPATPTPAPPSPEATVTFDTVSPEPPPPAVNDTEITTPEPKPPE